MTKKKIKTKRVLMNAKTGKFTSTKYAKTHPEKAVRVTCCKKKKCC